LFKAIKVDILKGRYSTEWRFRRNVV